MRLKGVVYDVGRAMGPWSPNWRPDYSRALMRRELNVIQTDLHANAVRLASRDPRRLLEAADYAISIGLHVLIGPELWNATPQQTLRYVTEVAAAAEPLFRRFPEELTFCVGNELTLLMRGMVPGRNHAQRTRVPGLREFVLSDQETLRAFLADLATSVRRVYGGPITYCALPFERVDWSHFDLVSVNYYRQSPQGLSAQQYLSKITEFQAAGKPVLITELGFASCEDADNPEYLGSFNATGLSLLCAHLPGMRRFARMRVRTEHQRDEPTQARLLADQLQLLDQAGVDGAFIMCFSFPLARYSADARYDIDATSLSLVRALPRNQHGTTYPDTPWEPKQAFHAVASYYATR